LSPWNRVLKTEFRKAWCHWVLGCSPRLEDRVSEGLRGSGPQWFHGENLNASIPKLSPQNLVPRAAPQDQMAPSLPKLGLPNSVPWGAPQDQRKPFHSLQNLVPRGAPQTSASLPKLGLQVFHPRPAQAFRNSVFKCFTGIARPSRPAQAFPRSSDLGSTGKTVERLGATMCHRVPLGVWPSAAERDRVEVGPSAGERDRAEVGPSAGERDRARPSVAGGRAWLSVTECGRV
jgi:hypothetical protein